MALDLSWLDLPADLKTQQVSVVTGNAEGLLVKDGQIRFITPEDPGVNTEVVLKVALANADVLVPVEIES
ncbi:MAG: hypothetical protein LBP52_08825, partial [Burkholderiaceae bacterium]|nr:hypothetical protein [Burkholderiaceae bacterium]